VTKEEFYRGKSLVRAEWWVNASRLPDVIAWARLRVFEDRASDVLFEDGTKVFNFNNEQYGQYFLGEDEFICLSKLDADDEVEYGISLAVLIPPDWKDDPVDFEYLGVY
jgi:hypothetical protein